MSSKVTRSVKLLLLGDGGTGKTSFVKYLIKGIFEESDSVTLQEEDHTFRPTVRLENGKDVTVEITLVDTCGQLSSKRNMIRTQAKNPDWAILFLNGFMAAGRDMDLVFKTPAQVMDIKANAAKKDFITVYLNQIDSFDNEDKGKMERYMCKLEKEISKCKVDFETMSVRHGRNVMQAFTRTISRIIKQKIVVDLEAGNMKYVDDSRQSQNTSDMEESASTQSNESEDDE